MGIQTTEFGVVGPAGPRLAIVGCFTTQERKARGTGLRVFRYTSGERWTHAARLDGIVNPSYLRADPKRGLVYAVHGDATVASAYAIDPVSGSVKPLGEADSAGRNGVAADLDPSGRFLFVANYSSGSVTTLPVNHDGSLADATHRLDLPGPTGPHRSEQATSHPHDAVIDPSGRFLVVPDKGLDRVFVLRPDERTGELSVASYVTVRPGSGPRHIAFHPKLPRAYVVNEIDSTVVSMAWDADAGSLTPLHVVPALPDSFFGHSTAAEIVLDPAGRFLYVSNRGADSVTRFSVDNDGERLTLQGWVPAGGADPRYMTLSPDGTRLIVANEHGDSIVEFDVDLRSGGLAAGATVAAASPSAIVFL
jgi:6-phosphogluconolactonase